ncbi:MAG: hypothetical protein HY578_07395 [Nitrospinae bacterium]|nr:hypothetical protein [Nitrospinota bacterium]
MYYKPIFSILLIFFLGGCGTTVQRSQQFERVAKDWSLSIRASQIIPVYPLSEDIQPGDVFLTQVPIEKQIEEYKSKGFLLLDNLIVRLHPEHYDSFYSGGYGIDNTTMPPRHWQFPATEPKIPDYHNAPRSAFPSYTFSVSRSEGFTMAIPVNAVPVGLNLLSSAQAHGSITIADSYTYGIDMNELWLLVKRWGEENRDFLKQFAPYEENVSENKKDKQKMHYLRVVTRVYLTGKVNVSLFSDEAFGGTAAAGIQRPVDLLNLGSGTDASKNFDLVNQLISKTQTGGSEEGDKTNQGLSVPAVGGTLKVTMASSRSISLVETFPRPLVIGYIGFDLPVLENGELGSPISTKSQLIGESVIERPTNYGPDENTNKIRSWLKDDKNNRGKLREFLKSVNYGNVLIANILNSIEYKELRFKIVEHFKIK